MDRTLRYNPRTHAIGLSPDEDIFDEPAICVSINQKWVPYVTGALEVLMQPEYWAEGRAFRDTDAILRLIENLQRTDVGCAPTNDFNWRLIPDPAQVGDSPLQVYQNLLSRLGSGWYGAVFVVVNCGNNCEDATQVTGIGESGDAIPVSPVGGHVVSFEGHLLSTVIGNVWNVETTDCLGFTQVRTFGGQEFLISDEEIQHFQVNALGPFRLRIIWDTNWTCGQA